MLPPLAPADADVVLPLAEPERVPVELEEDPLEPLEDDALELAELEPPLPPPPPTDWAKMPAELGPSVFT